MLSFSKNMNASTIAYYTTHWAERVQRYESAIVPDLHALLTSSFLPGSRLLELGCGSGRDAAFMLASGFDVTASDAVGQMIDAAAGPQKEYVQLF
jgi:2-polyprenyl-3-methyl-5-hydroxy-6-metoxy-1,4-benzoquinol methylase